MARCPQIFTLILRVVDDNKEYGRLNIGRIIEAMRNVCAIEDCISCR